MAESLKETSPKNNCFLGCFGFSTKKKKPIKKKTRLFSWQLFRLHSRNNKSSTKTVPLDNIDKAEVNHRKTKTSNPSSKPHKPSRQNSKAYQRLASTNQVARETPKEGRPPQGLPKPKKTQTKLSHTVSLPVLEGGQRVANPRVHAPVNSTNLRLERNQVVEKFDRVIMGMSIITVTLIIMLLWGRVCSILCTSAWLYFCPPLRTRINSIETTIQRTTNSNDIHLSSKDYKKKVVLEGLLERNSRITL